MSLTSWLVEINSILKPAGMPVIIPGLIKHTDVHKYIDRHGVGHGKRRCSQGQSLTY